FRQNALRGFCRCEAREGRLPTQRGGIAAGDDGTATRRDHRRREAAGEIQQRHGVDLEVPVEHLWIDIEKTPESAADRVVDQHRGDTERVLYRCQRRVELCFVSDVASKTA